MEHLSHPGSASHSTAQEKTETSKSDEVRRYELRMKRRTAYQEKTELRGREKDADHLYLALLILICFVRHNS